MSTKGPPVDVVEVIDSSRYLGWPLAITILTILIMLVDGYDLQSMSFVAPAIVADWGVTRADLSWVLNGSLIGMAIGSVILGRVGDRIGRKSAFIASLLSLCAGSLLSARARGLTDLFIWRTATGIGLGGLTPLAAAFIAEWTPRRVRNVAVACAIVSVPLGGMLGAIVAQQVIPPFGWRAIFWIGALMPLLFVLLATLLLPESPRYLAQIPAHSQRLAALLNRLVREPRYQGNEHFHVDEPAAPAGNWFSIIVGREYLRTTLLLWAAFAFNTLGLYSYANWLPAVLTSAGFTQSQALHEHTFFNLGGFFGAVGGAFLINRYGSRLVGTGLSMLGVGATLLIGGTLAVSTSPAPQLTVLILAAGTAFNGMQAFLYAVGAHSYPTYVRAAAVGSAQTISRIGGVLGGLAAGGFFALRPQPPVSVFFYVLGALVIAVAVSFFLLRTHIPPNREHASGERPA
ncbi:MAG TPA: MFS transporter [Steroidobacteraceae bacterium]|nr:MFS transporter [Steroidobacteraceae bacterium]